MIPASLSDHLGRRFPNRLCDGKPTEHSGHFLPATGKVQFPDPRDGPFFDDVLFDHVMDVGLRRDLGQMGDAKHLVISGQGPKALAHDGRDGSADARVNFVENQDR
ncbi:MAG: hypothetical protein ACREVZ_15185, partial [Burkholderiales bacterium]